VPGTGTGTGNANAGGQQNKRKKKKKKSSPPVGPSSANNNPGPTPPQNAQHAQQQQQQQHMDTCGSASHNHHNHSSKHHHSSRPASLFGPNSAFAQQKEDIWFSSDAAEKERIREFWLELSEDDRRALVKLEKEAVLKKMKEQQRSNCSCNVCGRKK
jgi:hypothetical protein